jgi:hypothetical protein
MPPKVLKVGLRVQGVIPAIQNHCGVVTGCEGQRGSKRWHVKWDDNVHRGGFAARAIEIVDAAVPPVRNAAPAPVAAANKAEFEDSADDGGQPDDKNGERCVMEALILQLKGLTCRYA